MGSELLLEALSALSGCHVVSVPGPSAVGPQDFVNIVALRQFYKQEGLRALDYPGVGPVSLEPDPDQDLYGPALALEAAGPGPGPGPGQEDLRSKVKIDPKNFFHPEFDFDFTNVQDGAQVFLRGGERYLRPCGWRRSALRVTSGGAERWLGTGADAWPVSYHAHNMDGSLGVILTHAGPAGSDFQEAAAAALGGADTLGRGVYSCADAALAERYCKVFRSARDGKTYKVLLQNRINPEYRRACQREGVWLVYLPEGSSHVQTRAIVQEAIRPYGLLIKAL